MFLWFVFPWVNASAGPNLSGLSGFYETPSAYVDTGFAYQNIGGKGQTVAYGGFFRDIFEGSYQRRFGSGPKSLYHVKMRLLEESMILPALAGGYHDFNEATGSKREFFVASKKVESLGFEASAGILRREAGEANSPFVAARQNFFSKFFADGEYFPKVKEWSLGVGYNLFPGMGVQLYTRELGESGGTERGYSVIFGRNF